MQKTFFAPKGTYYFRSANLFIEGNYQQIVKKQLFGGDSTPCGLAATENLGYADKTFMLCAQNSSPTNKEGFSAMIAENPLVYEILAKDYSISSSAI